MPVSFLTADIFHLGTSFFFKDRSTGTGTVCCGVFLYEFDHLPKCAFRKRFLRCRDRSHRREPRVVMEVQHVAVTNFTCFHSTVDKLRRRTNCPRGGPSVSTNICIFSPNLHLISRILPVEVT